MKASLPILLAVLAAFAMSCKTKPTPATTVKPIDPTLYKDLWSVIDSLDQKGLYRSALENVVEVKAHALTEGNAVQLVKAVTRKRTYDQQLEEDAEMNTLSTLEAEIGTYPEPARSILHAYAARWYNEYLNNNLWRISQQTSAMPSTDEDMRTWDVQRLTEKVIAHYMASVAWPGLRDLPVKDYTEILTEARDSDHLRPTLYDILAHEALTYFSAGQAHLTRPAAGFAMNDPRFFSVPETFITLDVLSPDTLDLKWRAIRIMQELLAFRLADESRTSALIDADVLRLNFIRQHFVGTDGDSLYVAALTRIIDRYAQDPESTLASHALAQYYADRAARWSPEAGPVGRYDYREAIRVAREAVDRFSKSYGGGRCAQLIESIEAPSLQLQMEDVALPDAGQLASLQYRNMEDAGFTLVRLPSAFRDWVDPEWDQEEMLARLKRLPVQATWRHALEDSADYQNHTTEIPVPALPFGHYALLVSGKPRFRPATNGEGSALFTVSRIGYWMLQDRGASTRGLVVDRLTGDPIEGVKVECYTPERDGRFYRTKPQLFATLVSDADGFVHMPNTPGRSLTFRFTKGADELYPDQGIYGYGEPRTGRNATTLFFADRAIYRPGQKVFFKGYAVTFDADRMPSVAANQSVSVSFRDANNQEIAVRSFVTNAYGTFNGSFDIPQGGLTGHFRLESDFGSGNLSVRVEEYKRPKYEVTFDTLATAPALGETVDLTARAMNYAGSAVAGARYTYTVKRSAQWPWWWRGFRHWPPTVGDEQVLVNAEGTTGNAGSVPVRFDALAPPDADQDVRYVFEVHVTVTDVSGESHEAIKSFTLSRQGFDVEVGLSEKTEIGELRHVRIQAQNADDKPVPLTAKLAVTQVQGPSRVLRDRLWSVPDMPLLRDAEYQARFPSYSPPGMQEMEKWPVLQRFDPVTLSVDGNKPVDLTGVIKAPGHYQLSWTWTDARGKTLTTTQFVTVYSLSAGLPPNEFAVVYPESSDLEPGKVLRAAVVSGLKTPPRFFRVIERRKDGEMNWITADGRMKDVATVAEPDRGGLVLHHFAVHDNRFFEYHHPIAVPWSNKELDVKLTTWRDKTEPGGKETWSLTVSGKSGDKVSAEVLLSMYDASLDAFVPHQWSMQVYPAFYSRLNTLEGRPRLSPWWMSGQWGESPGTYPDRAYRMLLDPYMAYGGRVYMRGGRQRSARADTDMILQAAPGAPSVEEAAAPMDAKVMKNDEMPSGESTAPVAQQAPPLRTALEETVFFYPEMHTDSAGNLVFTFVMKEALTRWKFQALAHTEALRFGLTSAETETRKDLMVFPNAPRFFREGDTIAFPAKVTNLSDRTVTGSASLRILNAITDEDVTTLWGGAADVPLSIAPGLSSPVAWTLTVPAGWTLPVKYQVRAAAGKHTDGEEAWVPVVTNRILITETLPLPLKANERRTFVFASMTGKRSPTQVDHGFTVEMTTSPAWYAVQALPYLMEYPHECAEQVFGRYYAHALGARILELQPDIAKVYEQWRQTDDAALLSPLQKNQELKTAMLEETPWVRDALGEAQQRRDMALLFDRNRLAYDLDGALRKLSEMQLPGGGFPWFKGGYDSWYITQYIVEGFGHLRKLGVASDDPRVRDIVQGAIPYLDGKMLDWYRDVEKRVKKGDAKWEDHHVGAMQAHYLYTRSFYPEIAPTADMQVVIDFLNKQFTAYWLSHGLYEQGLIALGANRYWPDDALAATITASLRERAVRHDELGRYWKTPAGYYWQDAPIERQSLMIELFQEMKVPQAEIDEYRVWLLKQKQTRQWPSTKSTASAIYALLIHPDAWLRSVGQVTVTLGKDEVMKADDPGQAGSGYVKKQWAGDAIRPDWHTVTATNPNAHIAWGAAYWQFWEDIDKVKSAGDPNALKVTRQILKVVPGDRGPEAVVPPGGGFAVGDRLMVRITIETDRTMEFVHVKDLRASGVEPLETLSGYTWSGGLGYYRSTRDLATHFFIERLPRGKYVLEYEVFAAQAGHYSAGLTTAACMYAPEFADHTAGIRMTVRPDARAKE